MKRLKWSIHPDWWLVSILVVSSALRVFLAWQGGQIFIPDEGRYLSTRDVLHTILHDRDWSGALEATFSRGDHLGFRVIMIAPAFLQNLWDLNYSTIAMLGSGFFSVLSIFLAYGIVRRLGGEQEEARWAALFMAVSNSLFYWSRHILPYDMALGFALSALFVGVHPQPGWRRSLAAGLLGFCAFITYNGYWTVVGVVLAIHVLRGWPSMRQLGLRAMMSALGLAGPMLGLLWWAYGRHYPLIDSFYTFSESINQGNFSDGHRIILEYLWYSEHGLLIIWLISVGYFAIAAARGVTGRSSQAWIGLGGVLALAVSLIWFSNVEQKFVVYGRLVRQMVPFFALLGGWVAVNWCTRPGKGSWRRPALALLLVTVGAFNLSVPLGQRWNFAERAIQYRDDYRQRSGASEADRIPLDRFQLVMHDYIWPLPKEFVLPPHDVLMREEHLLQFEALLYEGFNREQRSVIRATDISSRLILIKK